mgnify:CR=1 FL=1
MHRLYAYTRKTALAWGAGNPAIGSSRFPLRHSIRRHGTQYIAQTSLVRDGTVDISPGNYHAIAAVVAFLVALTTRHLFMAIIVGLTCFTLLKLFT